MKFVAIAAMAIGILSAGPPASAHHSYATFAHDKKVTISGVVHEFLWTNPHASIEIDVIDAKGEVERWSVECNSPNILSRVGWKATSLKPGDKVRITVNPLKNGGKGGSFLTLTKPDGTVLTETHSIL